VSGANFKSDLKHLAEDLKQFEERSHAPPTQSSRLSAHENLRQLPLTPPPEIEFAQPAPIFKPAEPKIEIPRLEYQPRLEPQIPPAPPRIEMPPSQAFAPAPTAPKTPGWPVDSRSQNAARELQQRLNLSTEAEALRMLVTLGAEAAKKLFP
jgi:hypothetical protein